MEKLLGEAMKTLFEEVVMIAMGENDESEFEMPGYFGRLESVKTFEEAQLLTRDSGVVLQFANGAEFQLSIARSR